MKMGITLISRRGVLCLLILLSAATGLVRGQDAYNFSTLAGATSKPGSSDRYGSLARFNQPMGLALDDAGVVYVADFANGTIRTISGDGNVATYLGKTGSFGYADGSPDQARFGPQPNVISYPEKVGPSAVAFDAAGALYILDPYNNFRIAKFANGVVKTLMGSSRSSYDGAYPLGTESQKMAIDPDGSIWLASTTTSLVGDRVTSVSGALAQWPGDGGKRIDIGGIGLGSPTTIVSAGNGTVFVLDAASLTLVKVDAHGTKTFVAGSGRAGTSDGVGAAASFGGTPYVPGGSTGSGPRAMTVDSGGTVFLCDTENNTIRKITPAGEVTTVAGTPGAPGFYDGLGAEARFSRPSGIAVDKAGNLYVADTANHTIRKGTPAYRPRFATQPQSVALDAGQSFTVSAKMIESELPEKYQWRRNGQALAGATTTSFTVAHATTADFGNYTLVATNDVGETSSAAALVGPPAEKPIVTTGPTSTTVGMGERLTLSVSVGGKPAPSVQWYKDAQPIAGATSATFVIPSCQPGDAGSYTATATNSAGAVTSDAAMVVVNWSRIVNVSIRTGITATAPMVTVGFVVADGNKPLLVRTVGPTLKPFGVGDAILDPKLALFKGEAQMTANDNWPAAANAADIAMTAKQVGAFPLGQGAADAALLTTLNGSAYTVQATGVAGATGTTLIEVYDADAANGGRLVNVSSRAQVGTGDNVLVAGFAVTGTVTKKLLIRAVGPMLGTFGVAGALSDPKIELIPSGATTAMATNDNWAGDPALAAAFTSVGAFPFASNDARDAALIVTVSPGSYSAKVSGVNGATGEALVEIYELP